MIRYDISDKLNELEEIIFDNTDLFIEMYCQDAYMLVDVFFGSDSIYIHYVMDNGQHISDSISIDEFEEFLNSVHCKNSNC